MITLYRWLLLLYPGPVRREYGEEMVTTFGDHLRYLRRTRGPFTALRHGLRSLVGLVVNAALEHVDHGRTEAAARRATVLSLPDETSAWEGMMMGIGKWWRDLGYAVRQLRRSPGFTVVAVASLALGIGANSAIFSLINAVFLRPLPVEDPSSVYEIYTYDESNAALNLILISIPNYEDMAEAAGSFERLAAYSGIGFTWTTENSDPAQAPGMLVTGDYFGTLGIQPLLGRLLTPSDDEVRGASPVAVVSHSFWMNSLGGDGDVVGRSINLNGYPFTIVGVTPPDFRGTSNLTQQDRIWIPLAMRDEVLSGQAKQIFDLRRALPLIAVGRLSDAVSPQQAQAELSAIASRLEAEYPDDNHDRTFTMVPLTEAAVGVNQRDDLTRSGVLLMSIVGLVLLIACANLANLLLARSAGRARELGLRASLGAGRWDLVRQMLAESLAIAGLGGLLGLAVAAAGSRLLIIFRPQFIPQDALEVGLDGRVVAFTAAVSIATGLVFGLLPAIRASAPNLHEILKESSRGSGVGSVRNRLRSGLVIGEVALAIVGLMGAGLFIRSMQEASSIDPGWNTDGFFMMAISPVSAGYSPTDAVQFIEQAQDRILNMPGVDHAAFAAHFPLSQAAARTFQPESPGVTLESASFIGRMPIMPGYFEMLGIDLVEGRWMSDDEYLADGPHSALVNRATVNRYWPGGSAVGQRFTFFNDPRVFEIVGVVEDVAISSLDGESDAVVYFPYAQASLPFAVLHARTSGDPTQVMAAVRDEIQAMDSDIPINALNTADDLFAQTLWPRTMGAALLSIFAALALVMAAAGIHAVMSYVSALRRHEIGIRMALGAESGEVLWMVLRQGMTLVAVGAVVGVGITLLGGSLISGMLYGVEPADPITLVAVPLVLGLVAFFACGIPAWRSTRVDPVEALQRN